MQKMLLLLYRNLFPSAKSLPLHIFKRGGYSLYYLDEETEKLCSFSELGNECYRNNSQIWVSWASKYVHRTFVSGAKCFYTWTHFEASTRKWMSLVSWLMWSQQEMYEASHRIHPTKYVQGKKEKKDSSVCIFILSDYCFFPKYASLKSTVY